MKSNRTKLATGALASVLTAVLVLTGCNTAPVKTDVALTPDEAKQIAVDAYVYGYSLVTMEYTRRVMTNVR